MSVLIHDNQTQMKYKSTLIQASFQKAKELWKPTSDGNYTINNSPFISTPKVFRFTATDRKDCSMIYPAIFDATMDQQSTLARDDDDHGVTPAKRIKLSPRRSINISILNEENQHLNQFKKRLSSCNNSLLSTPIVKRRSIRSHSERQQINLDLNVEVVGTPPSILKVRPVLSPSPTPSETEDAAKIRETSITPTELFETQVKPRKRTSFGISPRKPISRTPGTPRPAVHFEERSASRSSNESQHSEHQVQIEVHREQTPDVMPETSTHLVQQVVVENDSQSTDDTFYSPNSSINSTNTNNTNNRSASPLLERSSLKRKSTDSITSRRSYKSSGTGTPRNTSVRESLSLKQTTIEEQPKETNIKIIITEPPQIQTQLNKEDTTKEETIKLKETPKEETPKLEELTKPVGRISGRRSLSRQVLENNLFAKVVGTPSPAPPSTASTTPPSRVSTRLSLAKLTPTTTTPTIVSDKKSAGIEVSYSKSTTSIVKTITDDRIEEKCAVKVTQTKDEFITETKQNQEQNDEQQEQIIKHVHNETETKSNVVKITEFLSESDDENVDEEHAEISAVNNEHENQMEVDDEVDEEQEKLSDESDEEVEMEVETKKYEEDDAVEQLNQIHETITNEAKTDKTKTDETKTNETKTEEDETSEDEKISNQDDDDINQVEIEDNNELRTEESEEEIEAEISAEIITTVTSSSSSSSSASSPTNEDSSQSSSDVILVHSASEHSSSDKAELLSQEELDEHEEDHEQFEEDDVEVQEEKSSEENMNFNENTNEEQFQFHLEESVDEEQIEANDEDDDDNDDEDDDGNEDNMMKDIYEGDTNENNEFFINEDIEEMGNVQIITDGEAATTTQQQQQQQQQEEETSAAIQMLESIVEETEQSSTELNPLETNIIMDVSEATETTIHPLEQNVIEITDTTIQQTDETITNDQPEEMTIDLLEQNVIEETSTKQDELKETSADSSNPLEKNILEDAETTTINSVEESNTPARRTRSSSQTSETPSASATKAPRTPTRCSTRRRSSVDQKMTEQTPEKPAQRITRKRSSVIEDSPKQTEEPTTPTITTRSRRKSTSSSIINLEVIEEDKPMSRTRRAMSVDPRAENEKPRQRRGQSLEPETLQIVTTAKRGRKRTHHQPIETTDLQSIPEKIEEYSSTHRMTRHQKSIMEKSLVIQEKSRLRKLEEQVEKIDPIKLLDKESFTGSPDKEEGTYRGTSPASSVSTQSFAATVDELSPSTPTKRKRGRPSLSGTPVAAPIKSTEKRSPGRPRRRSFTQAQQTIASTTPPRTPRTRRSSKSHEDDAASVVSVSSVVSVASVPVVQLKQIREDTFVRHRSLSPTALQEETQKNRRRSTRSTNLAKISEESNVESIEKPRRGRRKTETGEGTSSKRRSSYKPLGNYLPEHAIVKTRKTFKIRKFSRGGTSGGGNSSP